MPEFLQNMRWDWWELIGLVGEGLFFLRLIVQWTASEKARKPVLPISYWYMSLVGCIIVIFYAFHIGSFVVLLPQVVGIGLYARNLQLELSHRAYLARIETAGMNSPDYQWPKISVIIPAHNEENFISETLENICALDYPGPEPEIIVALNGCTDNTEEVVKKFGKVRLIKNEKAGISFGRNLGASIATGELYAFLDADTTVDEDFFVKIAENAHGKEKVIMGIAGKADHGGPVVWGTFKIANYYARKNQVSPPGGLTILSKSVFDEIGGFDEKLPQGTNTEFINRAKEAGAEYICPDDMITTTSVRRFEKVGIVRQMLIWRQNHREIMEGNRDKVEKKDYEVI
ncbi:MAG: lipid-A-disaccharide synthase N-terminal domain-containing protein, partial [Planctomycetes bacterium]|nr:lipid-A-disaccharide synthase N-terminal domain-containing protein [Planctomycetota bacterium]